MAEARPGVHPAPEYCIGDNLETSVGPDEASPMADATGEVIVSGVFGFEHRHVRVTPERDVGRSSPSTHSESPPAVALLAPIDHHRVVGARATVVLSSRSGSVLADARVDEHPTSIETQLQAQKVGMGVSR